MRLIDADALPEGKFQYGEGEMLDPEFRKGWNAAIDDIVAKEPTIECEIIKRIEALPLAAEHPKCWIPVTEKLPSESGDYLCTIPLDAEETYTEVLAFHKGKFYEADDEWGATYHDDVLAWMPLPTPYKGGDTE